MVIGLGIILLVLGLILVTGAVDLPTSWQNHIHGNTLGWILVAVGALAIVLGLIVSYQRARAAAAAARVEERRDYIDDPRPYDRP